MRYLIAIILLITQAATAEPPRVVTTVAPLFGIVADVMRGVAMPVPMVTAGTDPHYFSLKPSQVHALNNADILFVVGGEMEPWLQRVLPELRAEVVFLAEAEETLALRLGLRKLAHIGEETAENRGGEFDPHMWLNPDIALMWVVVIAEKLAGLDPENAATYRNNAASMAAPIATSVEELGLIAETLRDRQFIATHDSLQYLESRFNLNIVGALSSAAGEDAGARSIGRLIRVQGPTCLLLDETEGTSDLGALFPNLPQISLDPLGYEFAGQPGYLSNLYLSIAAALESCITAP